MEAFNKKVPGKPLNLDEMASPRAFKSHFPYDQIPCGLPNATPGKYIYVMRNPKDVFVSLHIHVSAIPTLIKKDWDDYFEEFLQGNVPYGYHSILTMSSVGGLTKMTIMCSFSSTRT